jgi:hypothetical protein
MAYELERIKELAPSAFRESKQGAAVGVSSKYQFMTTSEIIDGLGKMGWNVHSAQQPKTKKDPETAKHLLRFRHEHFGSLGVKGNIPEILLINSHDRTTSLKFHVGIFRLICSNGLVVADKTFSKLQIRHMNTTFEEVKVAINTIVTGLPIVFDKIEKFESISLSDKQQLDFATKAITTRYPEYINQKTNKIDTTKINEHFSLEDLLRVDRPEDSGNSVWCVYNRVQEKLIKGGFLHTGTTGKTKLARALTHIRTNTITNIKLWDLAESYC